MERQDAIDAAYSRYNAAYNRLYNKGKGLTFREGGQGAEAEFAQAYQRLVALGLATQVRGKYRGR